MKRLSEYKSNYSELLIKLPLYTGVLVCRELEHSSVLETYSYDEDGCPNTVDVDYWKENEDFYSLREIFETEMSFYGYCPYCNKNVYIEKVGNNKKLEPVNRNVRVDYNINDDSIYNYVQLQAENEFNERENNFLKEYFDENRNAEIILKCTSPDEHKMVICINYTKDGKLQKYGQQPAIIDFDDNLNKYKKVFKDLDISELNRAIGLNSHGVGVGSFVYLRRIFENIIYNKFELLTTEDKISSSDFSSLRMSEKIDYLKDLLPDTLCKNNALYGVLSKGIHQLSEKECLLYFNVVKDIIILILEEEYELREKEKKKEKLKKDLDAIKSKV